MDTAGMSFFETEHQDIRPGEDIPLIEKHTSRRGMFMVKYTKKVWRHLNKAGELMQVEITGGTGLRLAQEVCSMVLINDITV